MLDVKMRFLNSIKKNRLTVLSNILINATFKFVQNDNNDLFVNRCSVKVLTTLTQKLFCLWRNLEHFLYSRAHGPVIMEKCKWDRFAE